MSTSRGSVKSEGEFLLDKDGWKSEAEAIIRDVGEFVKVIHVSDALEVRKRSNQLTYYIGTCESTESYPIAVLGQQDISQRDHDRVEEFHRRADGRGLQGCRRRET